MSTPTSEAVVLGGTVTEDKPTQLPIEEVDVQRCLNDTGYLAREVLGYNYFIDEETGEHRQGGIVDYGPHGELVKFIDHGHDGKRHRLVMCPRRAMKTTIGVAWIIRQILNDPNIRILIGMEVQEKAEKTLAEIKDHFGRNERLRALFGDWVGEPWGRRSITVSTRTGFVRGATIEVFGVESRQQGDRANVIWVDDPVSWQQAKKPERIEKAAQWFRQLMFLLDAGGRALVTMTPYDLQDLSHTIRSDYSKMFESLVSPCGMVCVREAETGQFKLEGEAKWPNLPATTLDNILNLTDPAEFNAQMALKVMSPEEQIFYREQFKYQAYEPEFHDVLNAYVLTDTATTDETHSCYSVLLLALLDWDDTLYLVDADVGKWVPIDFREHLLDFVEKHRSRFNICGVAMETAPLNQVYMPLCEEGARMRGMPLRWIHVQVSGTDKSKNQRIRGLTQRLGSSKLVILDTFPQVFEKNGKMETLWNPQHTKDADGKLQPGGEFVNQFINFKMSGGSSYPKDIPDAIAAVDLVNHKKDRYIWPTPKPLGAKGRDVVKRVDLSDSMPGPRIHRHQSRRRGSFWSDLAARRRRKG